MKKIFLSIILLSALFSGCKKQLEETPDARFAITNLNASTLNALVIGAYEPLARSRGRLWESRLSFEMEGLAEYCQLPSFDQFYNYTVLNSKVPDASFEAIWTTFYEAIGRSNLLLKTINDDTQMAASQKSVAKGEALFIRSICYYWLVRTWGAVPLRLDPISGADNVSLPLSDVSTIYAQIIGDLKLSETLLPATTSGGRASAGAAKTALADVYLTLKDYPNARAKSKEVMDAKGAYGYDLVSSLTTLYSPTAATNSEDVFSIKFDQISGYGSFLPTYAAEDRAKAAGLAARGLSYLGAKKTAPLIQGWDVRDLRKSFNLYDSVTIAGTKVKANLVNGYDYFFGKYKDPGAADEVGAGNDFYLYRYADVLLIFAESDNQLNGPTSASYDAVNQVRRRAYGLSTTTSSSLADLPAGLSKQGFDDLLFRERGYEFFFEVKRWFDMVRTGRAATFALAAGKAEPKVFTYAIPNIEKLNNPAIK